MDLRIHSFLFLSFLFGLLGCASVSRYQPAQVTAPASVKVDSNREVSVSKVLFQFELKQIDINTLLEVEVTNQESTTKSVGFADIVLTTAGTKLLPVKKVGRYDASGKYVPMKSPKEKFELKEGESAKVIYTFQGPPPNPDETTPPQSFKLKGHIASGDKKAPVLIEFAGTP